MNHNINWSMEQHKQYAAEQERRARRETFATEVKKEREQTRRSR
jgi:hypothetical protein